MRITKLKLKNYRCFDEFEIAFPETYQDLEGNEQDINLHVLLAENMIGKSAILKALRIGLGARFSKMSGSKVAYNKNISISKEEHRVLGANLFSDIAQEVNIELSTKELVWNAPLSQKRWSTNNLRWKKYKTDATGRTKSATLNPVNSFFKKSYNRVLEHQDGVNPLFLYVGTEYIHTQQSSGHFFDVDGNAIQGYWYCLDDSNMEKYVFNWFEKLKETTVEQGESKAAQALYGDFPRHVLETFKTAVSTILPNITDVDWVKDTLKPKNGYIPVFNVEPDGYRTYEMLSDGYRYLILLIGELIVRGTLLNKHLRGNLAEQLTGVVLIDEFGIHLHPSMQSDTLNKIAKAFPSIQFIITTHSPLLVNGLHKEQLHILRELDDKTRVVEHPITDAIGIGADGILKEMFDLTTTIDDVAKAFQKEYLRLFQLKKKNELSIEELEQFHRVQRIISGFQGTGDINNSILNIILSKIEEREEIRTPTTKSMELKTFVEREVDSILNDILPPKK